MFLRLVLERPLIIISFSVIEGFQPNIRAWGVTEGD